MACESGALSVHVFLHILGVIFFVGGLGTQAVWKLVADRSRDARHIAAVHDNLLRVDKVTTSASALLVFASGYSAIRILGCFGGSIAGAPWALWGLILMFLALAIWWFGLRPIGHRMTEAAEDAAAAGNPVGPDYARRSVTWFALWGIVNALIVTVVFMMVFKWPQ